jgi:hypothetical protein
VSGSRYGESLSVYEAFLLLTLWRDGLPVKHQVLHGFLTSISNGPLDDKLLSVW